MTYSLVGILAICVHVIINIGIFRKNGESHFPAQRDYCYFLFSVIAYHATDALWGFFHEWRLAGLLYADTAAYFAMMALSVLLWTTFVIRYLEREDLLDQRSDKFGKALTYAGRGLVVVSAGFADFDPESDTTFKEVFQRADLLMYQRKRFLKGGREIR